MENNRVCVVVLDSEQNVILQPVPMSDLFKPTLRLPYSYQTDRENLTQTAERIMLSCGIQMENLELIGTSDEDSSIPSATILRAKYVQHYHPSDAVGAILSVSSIIEADNCDFGVFRLDEESRDYLRIYADYTRQD